MLAQLFEWIADHGHLLAWLSLASLAIFIISLLSLPWLVSLIPGDYFLHKTREPATWKTYHPVFRLLILISKNVLGIILLMGGILMLVIPGQGLLTIVMGGLLIDYPGKYLLERKIIAIHPVFNGINWLRSKRGRSPLQK